MKNIKIELGNAEAQFQIQLDDAEARNAFSNFVSMVLGSEFTKPKTVERQLTNREILYLNEKKQSVPVIQDTPKPRGVSESGLLSYIRSNVEKEAPKKSLIFYTCECGRNNYTVAFEGSSVSCPCGKNTKVEGLADGRYRCPSCDYTATFKVKRGSDFKEVKCKQCESLIDMMWHEDKKQFVSMNMVR